MKTCLISVILGFFACVAPAIEVILYDTGNALPESGATPLKIDADKWTKVTGTAGIRGDAVLCNQWTAVVVRKDGGGVDLYAQTTNGWTHRARLVPLAGENAVKYSGVSAAPEEGGAGVTVKPQGSNLGTVEFRLPADSPLLKATAKGKTDGVRISAPCRWGVLPDFFTDDLLVDARQVSTPRVEIPIERMFIQLLDEGNSILAIFIEKGVRDIQAGLDGEGEQRKMKDTDVFFSGGNVWVGTMENRGIWHCRELTKEENQKGAKVNWVVPFVASWKGDFTQADGNVHSEGFFKQPWEQQWINWSKDKPKKTGELNIPGDPNGRKFSFEGPLVVYPLRRNDQTPLDVLLLDDFMRLSLGSGPCAHILDVAGRKGSNRGIFTCSYDWTVPRMITTAREEMTLPKEERVMLRHIHKAVITFMEFIEGRIGLYADFRKEMLAMLDDREKKNPDLAEFVGKLKKIIKDLPEKAPAGSKPIGANLKAVEKAILNDTPEQMAASLAASKTPPGVAEPQDVQLAACRRIVKILRARAISEFVRNPALGKNPAAAEIVKEIQEKSQTVMHGAASHEGFESTMW